MADFTRLASAIASLSRVCKMRTFCDESGKESSVDDDLKHIAAELQSESEWLSDKASELSRQAWEMSGGQPGESFEDKRCRISQSAAHPNDTTSGTVDQALRAAESARRAAEAARLAAESVKAAARSQWEGVGATARAVVESARHKAARAKERQREAQVNIDMVQRVWRRIADCGRLAATSHGSDKPRPPQEVMADFVDMCRSRPTDMPNWDSNKFGRKVVDIDVAAAMSSLAYAEAAYDTINTGEMTRDEFEEEQLAENERSASSIFVMCPDLTKIFYMSPEGKFEVTDPLKPRFIVALRNDGTVVLAIRGTATLADAITDMLCDDVNVVHSNDHDTGSNSLRVHRGINAGAVWVVQNAMPYIRKALSSGASNGRLLITGHSLGGGVALVAGILIAPELSPRVWVESIAFGPPPVLSDTLQSRGWRRSGSLPWNLSLKSYVNDGDVISRTCMYSLEYLFGGWGESTSHLLADYEWSTPLVIPGKVYVIGTDPSHPRKAILTNGMDPTLGESSLVDFFCEIARADRPMIPKAGYAHLIDSYKTALLGEVS